MVTITKYPPIEALIANYYKNLRNNIRKEFIIKSNVTGEKFTDSATCLEFTDLKYINNLYYKEQNHEARCFTSLDWQGAGRVSEVIIYFRHNLNILLIISIYLQCYDIKWKKLSARIDDRLCCLQVKWFRPKTTLTDNLLLMPNPHSFELCPINAIAVHAALLENPSDMIFASMSSSNNGGTYINSELKRITQLYLSDSDPNKPKRFTEGLTSHSFRSGAHNCMQ